MNNIPHTNSIGRLEIIFYVAALVLGLGSIVGDWAFMILAVLIPFAILCGIVRDVVSLSRLRAQANLSISLTEKDEPSA